MSTGFLILIIGVILFISTFVWTYVDNKNKDQKEQELLKRASTNNSYINRGAVLSNTDSTELLFNDETEKMEDSTELLEDTVLLENVQKV